MNRIVPLGSMSQQKLKRTRGIVRFSLPSHEFSNPLRLKHPLTIIGRERADIVIKDSEVSASHCQIQDIEGNFFIFDMNSTNGTYVNDKKIIKTQLKPSDIIRVGQTKFQFDLVDTQEALSIPLFDKYQERRSPGHKTLLETLLANDNHRQAHTLKIQVTYPDNKKELLNINRKETQLGRDSFVGSFDCDPCISPKHLLIKINREGEVFIKDLNSQSGTYVNANKITTMKKITAEDEIRIGATILQIKK